MCTCTCASVKESFFFQRNCNKSYIKRMNFVICTVTLWLLWSYWFNFTQWIAWSIESIWYNGAGIYTIFPHLYYKWWYFKNARHMILPIYHRWEHRCPVRNINNIERKRKRCETEAFCQTNSHPLNVSIYRNM